MKEFTIKCYEFEELTNKGAVMELFRIENIQKAMVNGRNVKIFKAFEYDPEQKAYIYCGTFEAPQNTPSHKLENFIQKEELR